MDVQRRARLRCAARAQEHATGGGEAGTFQFFMYRSELANTAEFTQNWAHFTHHNNATPSHKQNKQHLNRTEQRKKLATERLNLRLHPFTSLQHSVDILVQLLEIESKKKNLATMFSSTTFHAGLTSAMLVIDQKRRTL